VWFFEKIMRYGLSKYITVSQNLMIFYLTTMTRLQIPLIVNRPL